jgi:hypothetical protein
VLLYALTPPNRKNEQQLPLLLADSELMHASFARCYPMHLEFHRRKKLAIE